MRTDCRRYEMSELTRRRDGKQARNTVKVLLLRHAHAVADGPGLADSDRYLSSRGREAARAVGNRLREAGVVVSRVWTSPLVRAVQTAELVVESAGFAVDVETLPALGTEGSPHAVVQQLSGVVDDVLLVGHMPSISTLGALLVGETGFISLRPAEVALIDRGQPVWRLDPETLVLQELLLR